MKDIERHLEKYLWEVLGSGMSTQSWDGDKSLPQFLREGYRYLTAKILGREVILMLDEQEAERTPSSILKQVQLVEDYSPADAVYIRDTLTSWTRRRLIEHKVQFIVPGTQLYIPFLGLDLRENKRRVRPRPKSFRPAAQLLLLHVLHNHMYSPFTPTEVSGRLPYSLMTISRAFDEFEANGIGEHRVVGKERFIRFPIQGRELWEAALPYLESPVRRSNLFEYSPSLADGIPSGLSALAHYTEIAEPRIPVIAMHFKAWKALNTDGQQVEVFVREPGVVEVEQWKYPPDKLAGSGVVDRLSLYLALQEIPDERVEKAVDFLLDGVEW